MIRRHDARFCRSCFKPSNIGVFFVLGDDTARVFRAATP